MKAHSGEHPRFGAMDVCPFVPVRGTTMTDCVDCAHEFGRRAGEELGIPVYLYGEAAAAVNSGDHRRLLPQVREGEYEAIEDRIKETKWKPDFGPAEFIPSWGATAAGARKFLIAYNINLLGTKEQATRIARNIREDGRGPNEPGRLPGVKGIGWDVDEYGLAQISVNITDHEKTPMHVVFEEVKKDAAELGLSVVGSEVVGLIPLSALLDAASFYEKKEGAFVVSERQKVILACERLGLNSVASFDPSQRVVEYMTKDEGAEPLASLSVRDFVEILGARTAAPGGGSAAALHASCGAALGAMMGWMSFGSKKWESIDGDMRASIKPLHEAMMDLIPMIDADTNAFNDYMEAMRLPKETDEEKRKRDAAMQAGLKVAIDVPLNVMRVANQVWPAMQVCAELGNLSSKSDLQVGARSLELGIWSALKNVEINMGDITDEDYKTKTLHEAQSIHRNAEKCCSQVLQTLDNRS
tara:strand:- start:787 stop:2196 length:1410 start_codon:yes stop_codon:yes gene_type:complete